MNKKTKIKDALEKLNDKYSGTTAALNDSEGKVELSPRQKILIARKKNLQRRKRSKLPNTLK